MNLDKIKTPEDIYEWIDTNIQYGFVLYHKDGKVYHLEHPNHEKKGIYEYASENDSINTIVNYYVELRGGKESPTTQFFEVPEGLSS